MQKLFFTPISVRLFVALAVGLSAVLMDSNGLHAEVVAIGDVEVDGAPAVDPDLPLFGSDVDTDGNPIPTGQIVVGVTDIGRMVIDVPSVTNILASKGAIIGDEDTAIGEVEITGFGSEWQVQGPALIGNKGLAFLNLVAGGRFVSTLEMDDDGEPVDGSSLTIMGNEAGSSSITTIDGFGSRLQADHLVVGREGEASISIINRGNMITRNNAAIGVTDPNDFLDFDFPDFPPLDLPANDPRPTGSVTVTGLGSRWTVQDSLVIGNDGDDDETGVGILYIADQAVVQVGNFVANDEVVINELGRIELAGGTFRSQGGTSANQTPIFNVGVIKGDGLVDGAIDNFGEIRNAAAVANLREILLVTGEVVNDNLIESLGGEMEFLAPVTNTINGDMIFRDAVVRFQQGLDNAGEFAFGGATTIYGDIDSSNTFLVLPDTAAVIRGNLQLDAGAVAAFTVGSTVGTMDIIGTASIDTGAFLSLNYSAGGVLPQVGDSYNLLTAHEGLFGSFGNTQTSAGGLLWDISYSATTVTVTAGGVAIANGSDFNGDGIVNEQDLAIWQANYGRTAPPDLSMFGDADGDGDVDGRDFIEIQRHFGGPPLMAEDGAAFASVPEPSALLLLVSASVCLLGRRKAS